MNEKTKLDIYCEEHVFGEGCGNVFWGIWGFTFGTCRVNETHVFEFYAASDIVGAFAGFGKAVDRRNSFQGLMNFLDGGRRFGKCFNSRSEGSQGESTDDDGKQHGKQNTGGQFPVN